MIVIPKINWIGIIERTKKGKYENMYEKSAPFPKKIAVICDVN